MTPPRAPLETAEQINGDIGRLLNKIMPEGWGFFLCLASYGEAGVGFKTYSSSIERADAIKLLREMANDLETDRKEV